MKVTEIRVKQAPPSCPPVKETATKPVVTYKAPPVGKAKSSDMNPPVKSSPPTMLFLDEEDEEDDIPPPPKEPHPDTVPKEQDVPDPRRIKIPEKQLFSPQEKKKGQGTTKGSK